jgi:ATP-binding cassette subfamily C (CFTR/MRP) protein 1
VALLVLQTRTPSTKASIPAATLSMLAALAVLLLSPLEHSRSLRPSIVLNIYLLISIAFDSVQVRTLYLRNSPKAISALSAATVGIKITLFGLEALSKRRYLRFPYQNLSPETTSGIISLSLFWWLNPIFLRGLGRILTLNDLFITDQALLSRPLFQKMSDSWTKCG